MKTKLQRIRCGSGLGDSLYLAGVINSLIDRTPHTYMALTRFPGIFRCFPPSRVATEGFSRSNVHVTASYGLRRSVAETNQWQDCLITAAKNEPLVDKNAKLLMPWRLTNNNPFLHAVRERGRRAILVQLFRQPMDRPDGFGQELLPNAQIMQKFIDDYRDEFTFVQVGAGAPLHKFKNLHYDFAGQTSVEQLIDLAFMADGLLGYVSFFVPLAEVFDKPALFVWSHAGMTARANMARNCNEAGAALLRTITPKKILSKETSHAIVDNQAAADQFATTEIFLRRVRGAKSD